MKKCKYCRGSEAFGVFIHELTCPETKKLNDAILKTCRKYKIKIKGIV